MRKIYAPVALFAYKRPIHLRKAIEALLCNQESSGTDLYVFSDGAKDDASVQLVDELRQYLKSVTGFKSMEIIERNENLGLGKSIIAGVSEMCKKHGRVIVLEDDLVCAPFFLKYMNDALYTYENELRVASIHGYALPLKTKLPETYFIRGADCLGWATWSRAWDYFEADGSILLEKLLKTNQSNALDLNGVMGYKQMLINQIEGINNSWAVRWHISIFLREMLTLTPKNSLICHIGNDGTGTNFGYETFLDTKLYKGEINVGGIDIVENQVAPKATEQYFRNYNSIEAKIIRKIKKIFNE